MRTLILSLAALLVLAGGTPAAPNVVLIISDDQAWTDYGFMGHPHVRTPNIDRLAAQSAAFTHGYVPTSLCCPSLATILTGLYPHQHKITANDPPLPPGKNTGQAFKDPQFLAQREEMIRHIERVPTLARLLGRHGYLSFQSGKWWLGEYKRGGFTAGMTHGDTTKGGRHGDEGLKIGRQGMRPVLDFIDSAVEQKHPFFLWYAPMMPHQPHNPPERLLAHYKDKTPSLQVAKYWAMCEWFDETCGQLLDHLQTRKIADDTIVLYLADNGWIQDPDKGQYAPRSKRSPYDGGLRTPILVRWPGKVQPHRCDIPVSSIDLVPTVLAACGVKAPANLPGVNLLDQKAVAARKAIFGAIFDHNFVDLQKPAANLQYRWCVSGGWKLIVPAARLGGTAKLELFHVAKDEHEKENLADRQPERVQELRKLLDEWWTGKE
jgi:arylsulfatase A-like enzyme